MSEAVLADAQFGVVRVFRPFLGFETVYQDQPVSVPIAIPGTLDPDAGKPGFVANLLAGIPLPLGSKMKAWVPTIFQPNTEPPGGFVVQPYLYRFVWRVRNLGDFRARRSAYHFPRQSPGTNNNFVVPSAAKVAIYENAPQDFPTNTTEAPTSFFQSALEARQSVVIESFEFASTIPDPPLTPTGVAAAYQQGLAASDAAANTTVSFNALEMDAEGDELIILVNRTYNPESEDRNWDFSGTDSGFSAFFGTDNGSRAVIRDMGIYLMTGSSP